MKPPQHTDPSTLRDTDKNYLWLTNQSFDIYPGWGQTHVFIHEPTRTYWAMDEIIDDDSSCFSSRGWYEVDPVTTTKYVRKP